MKRNTLILAALVVLLWGVWYLFSAGEKTELAVKEQRQFFQADSVSVDSIAIKYGSWSHLARRSGRWVVIFPDWQQDADPNILGDVFKFTNEMVLENLISTKAEKHATFQVDTLRGTILRFIASGTPSAEFVMGKAGADFNHTYIRRLGSDSVYMARGDFQKVFRRAPSDWGSKMVIDIDTTQLASIRWVTKDSEVFAARSADGSWLVRKHDSEAALPVDTSVFNVRLRRISPLRADAIALEGTGGTADLDNPYLQLIVAANDGRADTLLFNQPADDQRMFAFRPGRPKPLFIFYKGSFDRMSGVYENLVMKGGIPRSDNP